MAAAIRLVFGIELGIFQILKVVTLIITLNSVDPEAILYPCSLLRRHLLSYAAECAPEPATPANGRLPKIWPAGVAGGYTGDIASASRPAATVAGRFFFIVYTV